MKETYQERLNQLNQQKRKFEEEERNCSIRLSLLQNYQLLKERKTNLLLKCAATFLFGSTCFLLGFTLTDTVSHIVFLSLGSLMGLSLTHLVKKWTVLEEALQQYTQFRGYKREDLEREQMSCLYQKRRAHDLTQITQVEIKAQQKEMQEKGYVFVEKNKIIPFPSSLKEYYQDKEKTKELENSKKRGQKTLTSTRK